MHCTCGVENSPTRWLVLGHFFLAFEAEPQLLALEDRRRTVAPKVSLNAARVEKLLFR